MTTWTALESNPDVLTKYIHKLGVSPLWSLADVYGLDPEILEFIARPVKAVILLSPCSSNYENYWKEEDEKLKANPPTIPEGLFHMKQCIHNACGTIALVHGIANNSDIDLEDGGILKNYLNTARELSPEKRGTLLEGDSAFTDAHQELAQEGQTDANSGVQVNHHFIVFVNYNNELYELDGRKSYPVNHGATSADNLLQDAAKVCKAVMERDPDDVRFSVIALVPTQ